MSNRRAPTRGDPLEESSAGDGGSTYRRIEIVHESLLSRWPRLVRWQTQDQEGAQLRDEMRQAARLWDQHGRSEDYLWSGTAFREYQLWRERYPGGLTALEEAFGGAMTTLAWRRRRRRRLAVAALIVVLSAGLAVVGALREQAVAQARRAEAETRRAEAEALRAEASRLLAYGRLALEDSPAVALAYAIKSLELADGEAARTFALKALAAGPPATVLPMQFQEGRGAFGIDFSADGGWAALRATEQLQVLSRDGRRRLSLGPFSSSAVRVSAAFDPAGGRLYGAKDGLVRVWSVPGFELLGTHTVGGANTWVVSTRAEVVASTGSGDEERVFMALAAGSEPRVIGRMEDPEDYTIDAAGAWLAFAKDGGLYVRSLDEWDEPARRIATYEGRPWVMFHPAGDRVGLHDDALDEIRIWSLMPGAREPMRAFATPFRAFTFDPEGRRMVAWHWTSAEVRLWDLDAPAGARARRIPTRFGTHLDGARFSPDGQWLATTHRAVVCFWPLARREPRVLVGHQELVFDLEFTPDGGRLVSVDFGGDVREWALHPGGTSRSLARIVGGDFAMLDVDGRGRFLAVAAPQGGALVVPFAGGEPRMLEGFDPSTVVTGVAIDAEGRRVAAASYWGPAADKVIRVWDLETGEVRVLGPTEAAGEGPKGQSRGLAFLRDGSLLSSGDGGVRRWSVPSGSHDVVAPSHEHGLLAVFPDGRSVAHTVGSRERLSLAITDLETETTTILRSHGEGVIALAVDPTGTAIVSGSLDGIVRVGRVSGEEPHLLVGHDGPVESVAISPDGRWIASGGDDRTIRLWPMQDLSKLPLHVLPYLELLATLRSLTNLRVVERSAGGTPLQVADPASPADYMLAADRFPGWEEAPEW